MVHELVAYILTWQCHLHAPEKRCCDTRIRWSGLVWSGLVWSGLVWSGLVWRVYGCVGGGLLLCCYAVVWSIVTTQQRCNA